MVEHEKPKNAHEKKNENRQRKCWRTFFSGDEFARVFRATEIARMSALFFGFLFLFKFAASDGHWAQCFPASVGKKAPSQRRHFVGVFRQMGAKYSG